MESIRFENISFTYPGRSEAVLKNINFTVNQGEFVLVCGKSGCGKTTLLRLVKPSLSPYGEISGNVYFNGRLVADCGSREQASGIGFVTQNPDNQIVTDKVWHELAFGLENLRYKTAEIRTRVSEMASFFGIQNWFYKKVAELSGGQKQLLNLASVMVMQPSVLILDEPTSQLDPISANEFINSIKKINNELGITVILAEHRLEEVLPIADRVIVMDDGEIIANDTPRAVGRILKEINHDMYKAMPTPMRVHGSVKNSLPCPLTVRDGRCWLEEYKRNNLLNQDAIPNDNPLYNNNIIIEIKDAWFRYQKDLPDVIKGLNLSIKKSEIFCLVGGNGTGKSTALSLISGINTPYRGDVFISGQSHSEIKNLYKGILGVLPQNPQSVFIKKTVYLDLMEILSETKLSNQEKEQKIKDVALLCRIENLLDSHPYDLSGGEQQRAALAKILLMEPGILLLDEPTKGMDVHFKEKFGNIIMDLKSNGVTILLVSHDIEFCAQFADRCALFFDGSITSMGTPREFFKGNSFYTTAANRMARTCLSDAVLPEDIILACGGTVESKTKQKHKNTELNEIVQQNPKQEINTQFEKITPKFSKTNIMSIILFLFLIPFTIYIGTEFLGDRKYYLTSILIILETLIPFCMMFERRKPKGREVIVISVLCALAVVSRAAFFMLPQFKPVVAIVIVAGVCLGGEAGFLVGAVSTFISNFFFGHGPWTPWQMVALGVVGFISGMLFKAGILKKSRVPLCVFGFLSTVIIHGGIMNSASIIMWQNKITWEMLSASYAAGISFDIILALGTSVFLWFFALPMISKIERVKTKYGLGE